MTLFATTTSPTLYGYYVFLLVLLYGAYYVTKHEPWKESKEKEFNFDNLKQAILWIAVGVVGAHIPQIDAALDSFAASAGVPSATPRAPLVTAPDPTKFVKVADGVKFDDDPPKGCVIVVGFDNKQPAFAAARSDVTSPGAKSAYMYFQRTDDGETSAQVDVTLP